MAEITREQIEDSPERLKARREALGWNTIRAGRDIPVSGGGIIMCEDPFMSGRELDEYRKAYAAALSAEESARAANRQEEAAHHVARGQGAQGAEEQRRAQACAMHPEYAPIHDMIAGVVAEAMAAPEVVDVPQPIVKRAGEVEAQWSTDESVVIFSHGAHVAVPVALLRAMLAAIDAQHGGPPRKWGSLDWLEEQHGFDPVDPDRLGTLDRPFPPRDRPEPTAATSNGTAGGYVDGRLVMGGGGAKPERLLGDA